MITTPLASVPVTCRKCGRSWVVAAKADGSMPKGSRCLVSQGGCGTFARVPGPAAVPHPGAAAPAIPLGWDPPSRPYYLRITTEPCPDCCDPLIGSRTQRGCTVHYRVVPRGVRAPYERSATGRQVKSLRERDAEGRALEARRQRLLDELDALAADKRLTSEAHGILKWYRGQLEKAGTMARLDDLVDQARGERLPRTGWLSRPAAAEIEPPDYHDDDEDQADDDWEDDSVGEPQAITPMPPAVDLGAELAARGLRVRQDAPPGRCMLQLHHGPCNLAAAHAIGGVLLCGGHWRGLTSRRRPA